MVTIAGKDFNLDMDKYIKKRRTTYSSTSQGPSINMRDKINEMRQNMNEWKVFSLFRRKEREYDEDIEDDDTEDYEEDEAEIEAIDDIEDELEEKRESALRRLFKTLRFSRRGRKEDEEDYEVYEEEPEDNLEEIKEVIKITHKWLEELPPETIERFRRSEDFVKYKEALRKLKMIK